MKDGGKSVGSEQDYDYFSSSSSDLPCKKHPSNSSSVGICAYCLKEKLMKLVCSDCGEQRLSSCSCSESSSYRHSYSTVDLHSVDRISFLIENEKLSNGEEHKTLFSHMKQSKKSETEDVVLLKRSNSCVVDVKKSNGFWRIGKLFKKKRENVCFSERNTGGFASDYVIDVSRSRSLSSFMGGGFDEEMNNLSCSSAKVSDFNESEPRQGGFRGVLMDSETGFCVKESDFSMIDDDLGFIDLKLDLAEKSKTEHSAIGNGGMGSSSCLITVNERGIKKGKNSHSKVLKWIFKNYSRKKDLDHILES